MAPRKARFQHVVFARRARRAVNFAPGVTQASAALPLCAPLSADREKAKPRDDLDAGRLPISEAAFLDWLFATAGMDRQCYRVETLRRRLPACLRRIRAQTLSEAHGRIGALDPGARAFGVTGAGRLGDLGHDLYLLTQRALDARAREASAHATRLHDLADLVGRASGGYADIDESARRGQPEVS